MVRGVKARSRPRGLQSRSALPACAWPCPRSLGAPWVQAHPLATARRGPRPRRRARPGSYLVLLDLRPENVELLQAQLAAAVRLPSVKERSRVRVGARRVRPAGSPGAPGTFTGSGRGPCPPFTWPDLRRRVGEGLERALLAPHARLPPGLGAPSGPHTLLVRSCRVPYRGFRWLLGAAPLPTWGVLAGAVLRGPL